MELLKSIHSMTRRDRTETTLIPIYGKKNGKYKQVISQTIIEVRDLPRALEYKWNLSNGYAYNRTHQVYLHRHILNTPDGLDTDHINRNKLDNSRGNLRVATGSQSQMNKDIQSNNTSGFRGVHWDNRSQKWSANIKKGGKLIYLGLYPDIHNAVRAYNKASRKYHGDFGYRNTII